MKQFDVKSERTIDGNTFYVRPFPAFVSANLSGEVAALIVPVLGSLTPVLGTGGKDSDAGILDIDLDVAAPALASSMSGINGDKLENLLKKLLVKYGNISVQLEGENDAQKLTEDLANELFCGETQGLFILALDVIKANFSGFFRKLDARFGKVLNGLVQRVSS